MAVTCRLDDVTKKKALAGARFRGVVETSRVSEVADALGEVEEASRRGLCAVGFVAYEAAPAFDPALRVLTGGRGALPLVWFGLFEQLESVAPIDGQAGSPVVATDDWAWEIDEQGFAGAVKVIHDEIAAGMTYQVNMTTRLRRPFAGSHAEAGRRIYERLTAAQGGAYSAYLETPEWAVACGSPELFFSLHEGTLTARPMKGTARRGRYRAEDDDAAAALASSPKERAENLMIVDLTRNDLGRVAEVGTVTVPRLFALERYRTVWQMTSTVRCRLRPSVGLTELFTALFPAGSVTGAPKPSTMSLIAALEQSPRGPYCGAVGYVRGSEMRFAVGIRTAVLDARRSLAELGVGSGITWYADAYSEWDELGAKASVLFQSRPPAELLETLGYFPPRGYRNLERHVRRMAASASFFGWEFDERALRSLLADVARAAAGPLRVRASLSLIGRLHADSSPLDPPLGRAVRLEIDAEPVSSRDPKLFHKTADRSHLEVRLTRHPGADDVVIVNERGEVTETTRANLAVDLDGRWLTPAIDCGCLPGVERGRLLESGRLTEAVISVADLTRASRLAVISSLRGWRPATLTSTNRRGEGRSADT